MKKLYLLLLIAALGFSAKAQQSIVYHNLKEWVAREGDTIVAPRELTVGKRTKHQMLLQSGGDYKITSNRSSLRKGLKKKYYAVEVGGNLYVNCKKLKIKKFRFGTCYAPAMEVNNKIYFRAIPIGPAAVAVVHRDIGMGVVGEAVASSSVVSQRVYYEIDSETGTVDFVGKEKMLELLAGYPVLRDEYLKENNEEAHTTGKYLRELQQPQ